MSPFMEKLRERYLLRKGYAPSSLGCVAPEVGFGSDQVIIVAEALEEIATSFDERITALEAYTVNLRSINPEPVIGRIK